MNDLDSWIAKLRAEAATAVTPGVAPVPGVTPVQTGAPLASGLLSHPLVLPAVVGLITYFASGKDWKWAAAAAGAAVVLKK